MDARTIADRIKKEKILLISGSQGMGKSTLARETQDILKNEGFLTSLINCERENITPYSDLIKILNTLSGIGGVSKLIKPSKIMGYFVINVGGMSLVTALTKNESMDGDILAGMITAVRNFIYDTINMLGLNELSESPQIISSAGYSIIVAGIQGGYLAVLLNGQPAISTLAYVRRLSTEISFKYGEIIKKWNGNPEDVTDLQNFMHKKIDNSQLFYPERGEIVTTLSKNFPKNKAIVFIIDDAHWIDPSSLNIISSLPDWGMENIHILYFFNSSNAEKHESFIKIVKRNKDKIITLNPWNRAIVREKLVERYGKQAWIDELATIIVEKTGGIVILVMEMISKLEDYGILRKFGESYILNRKILEAMNPMSESSVGRIWSDRIDELPQETRKILKILSVIGDSISIDFAVKLTRMDEMALMIILDPAMEKEIVVVEGEYIKFKHQGLRKSLYGSLNPTQARIYHRYAGKIMEEMNEVPSRIAYHYWMARDAKGIKYLKKSVNIAEKMQSYLEMHKYCSMALDLVTDESDKFYFLAKEVKACNVLGYMDDSLNLIDKAEKLAKNYDDYRMVFHLLSSAYFRMGYYSKVVKAAEKFFEKVGDENRNYILLELARAMWRLGDLKRGEEYLKEILEGEMDDKFAIEAYRLYGVIKTSLHDDKSAEEYYLKSLDIAKRIGDLYGMSAASNNLAIIYVNSGDLEKGEQFYRQSLEFDNKLGDLRGRSLVMINLAELLITKGQIREGEKLFREIVEIKKSIGDNEGLGFAYNGLADTLFIQGKYKEALKYVLMACESFNEIKYKEGIGFTSSLASRIYFQLGKFEESFKKLDRSRKVFRELGDLVALENLEFQNLEFRIKMGEKVKIPSLKNDDNGESYHYVLSLLNMMDGNTDGAVENLKLCSQSAKKSKNFTAEKFYCGAVENISGGNMNCMAELEKVGAMHYLNEMKYFNIQK